MPTRTKATKVASHSKSITVTHSSDHASTEPEVAAAVPSTEASAPAATASGVAGSAPSAPAAPPAFIAPPPGDANIPPTPTGFEPTDGANFRGTQPRKAELVSLPLAIRDLKNFTNYAQIIGATAPPLAEVLQTFDVSNQWSVMRNATDVWDGYSREQEGIAWIIMRAVMERLKPAFELAAKTNPSIGATYAGLATLLGAKTVSAQRAVATKKANKQEILEGKIPSHGAVGKRRQRAAAKAALAAQNAQQAAPANPPQGAPIVAPPGATPPVVTAPAGQTAAPAAQPAAAGAPSATNGVTPGTSNGAPHS